MLKVVIDTNIIISAALSPNGNPSKIIDFIVTNEDVQFYYSTQILIEYKEVLSRKRLKISFESQNNIISIIQQVGILIKPTISTISMVDESDRTFYDTARTIGAILITGNIKHYPNESFIMTPSNFLENISG